MGERHAVVAGAGIGGVAVAAVLAQQGWAVTLLERAGALAEVGAGIAIRPSAAKILEALGAGRCLADAVGEPPPVALRTPRGRVLCAVPAAAGDVVPSVVHRGGLHTALTAALPDDVQIRTNTTVTGVHPNCAGATVTTTCGSEFGADLVVGADGIRSAVRASLYPHHAGPRYAGCIAYRGITTAGGGADLAGETWGPGGLFGILPMGDGRTYWYATARSSEPTATAEQAAAVPTRFAGWHAPIPALLAATAPETILTNAIYDLALPLPRFASCGVALLGDAAHAMTPNLGQGACAAIEDAAALVHALNANIDTPNALRAYDADRRRSTTRQVLVSRLLSRLSQLDHHGLSVARNTGFAALGALTKVIPTARNSMRNSKAHGRTNERRRRAPP